jgi:anti-sigma factor RsiW
MSCEPSELKEYLFGEMPRDRRGRIESHIGNCESCREELSRLQLTHAVLGALREEEMPRRIAFVSDKVFEPRWYRRIWRSGPQLGFIAASLLACAILVHAFTRPAPIVTTAAVATLDRAALEREVSQRIDRAVATAVAASEARQRKHTTELIQASERRHELDRRSVDLLAGQVAFIQRKANNDYIARNGLGSDGQ